MEGKGRGRGSQGTSPRPGPGPGSGRGFAKDGDADRANGGMTQHDGGGRRQDDADDGTRLAALTSLAHRVEQLLPRADFLVHRSDSATHGDKASAVATLEAVAEAPDVHQQPDGLLSVSGSCGSCSGSSSSRAASEQPPSRGQMQQEGRGECDIPRQGISGSGEFDVDADPSRLSASPHRANGSLMSRPYRRLPSVDPEAGFWGEGEGEFDSSGVTGDNGVSLTPLINHHGRHSSHKLCEVSQKTSAPRRACSHTRLAGIGQSRRGSKLARTSTIPTEAEQRRTPIHRLNEDLLVGIFQKLSTSEWRAVIPAVCRRWHGIAHNSDDLWSHVEVCPFENSEVTRRLIPSSTEDRYWALSDSNQLSLASSSLSREHVMRSLLPHALHVRALLLSCLSLTLTPASPDNATDEESSRPPRIVRASDILESDLVKLIRAMRQNLRQFMIRVSGQITTPGLLAEVCQARDLELLHAELGNVELDCSMMAPLRSLTSLRLRRDELSLSLNEGSMKLLNLHRLAECTDLTRLSLGLDANLEQLPAQIFNLYKLRTLEVDRCSKMDKLPAGISQLTSLETLSLAGSSSLPSLPPEMKSLVQLVSLNLDFCTKMSSLPTEIGSLSNLRMLSMEGGYAIFDDGVPFEIGMCSNLQSLVLADTHILSLPKLGRKLASCINLRVLYLDHNDDLQVESYPSELMALPKLTTLSMRKYERHSWSVVSTRNIARMQEKATHFRLQQGHMLQIIL